MLSSRPQARFKTCFHGLLVGALLAASLLASGCSEGPTLVNATLTFQPQPQTLVGATIYVTVYEVQGQTLNPIQSVEQEIEEDADRYQFELTGEDPPPGEYVMRVHVDVDGDGAQNTGDYVSSDVTIFQGTYPENVNVTLTPLE